MINNRAIKITDQGQITLPKYIRDLLGTESIKLEVGNDNVIRIIPLKDVAGSLTQYARKIDQPDFNIIREEAWKKSIEGRFKQ
jgi:AbrB family looped-hinge helix DNA binding protein